jgi:hypothetical protein
MAEFYKAYVSAAIRNKDPHFSDQTEPHRLM